MLIKTGTSNKRGINSTCSTVSGASITTTSAPESTIDCAREIAMSNPSIAIASVLPMIKKSSARRAFTADSILRHIESFEMSDLPSRWPQRFGKPWSSMCTPLIPAASNILTIRRTCWVSPYPVSPSANTAPSNARTIVSSLEAVSVIETNPRSGKPRLRAMAPPLAYIAVAPTCLAIDAPSPS